ncbi:MAG: cupin domain-containing protein [Candidatus Kerfeldbacteria bacterium]|nr:cupin domain-containing protein [Candidatus Kerfeldbacteria bacterium]
MRRTALNKLVWKNRFTYVKNVVYEADTLGQRGARFQIVRFRPGARIAPHYHRKAYEIFYIHSGSGKLLMNGKSYRLKANDIILCQPKDRHGFVNTGRKDLTILVFKTNEIPDRDIHWQ